MRKLLLALSLFVLSTTAAKAEPPTAGVVVTNDANSPVPVTVTGETTGTITGDVNVTNGEDSPVPVAVQEPPTEYVRERLRVTLETGVIDDFGDEYAVPQGKRIFFDSVVCSGSSISADELDILQLFSSGSGDVLRIPIINIRSRPPAPGRARSMAAYQLTSNFLDEGRTIAVTASRNNTTGRAIVDCTFEGRLVNLE